MGKKRLYRVKQLPGMSAARLQRLANLALKLHLVFVVIFVITIYQPFVKLPENWLRTNLSGIMVAYTIVMFIPGLAMRLRAKKEIRHGYVTIPIGSESTKEIKRETLLVEPDTGIVMARADQIEPSRVTYSELQELAKRALKGGSFTPIIVPVRPLNSRSAKRHSREPLIMDISRIPKNDLYIDLIVDHRDTHV